MTINAQDLGANLGEWNALVRRARMADRQKLAALTVSSYADPDGTGIRLTPPRLGVDLGVSYSTARRYLSWLREVGLIELTRAGNRRLGTASEYRLIIGPDVMEHIDVLSPSEVRARMDGMRESEREHTRDRLDRMNAQNQRSTKASVNEPSEAPESAESTGDQRSAKVSVEGGINAQTGVDQRSPLGEQHTFLYAPTRIDLPSRADDEDLRTAVTGPRASPEEPTPAPKRCPDGLSAATRPDGKPECPICRRRASRPGIEVPPPPEERLATVTQLRPRRPA
jgi:DNA-binding transcriptional ArsR family regulator